MERLLQYMDDIDDLCGAFGLVYERIRRLFLNLIALLAAALTVGAGVALALVHPPIALATCIVLFVTLLYRSATSRPKATLT